MSVLLFSPVCEREWCVKLDSPVSPDIDWTGARMMAKIYVCSLFVKHFRSDDFPTYFFLSLLLLLRVRIHRFREYVWKWTVYRHGVNKPMTRCANIWFKRRIRPIDGSSTMNHDRIWPSIYFVPEDLSWNIKSTILFAFIVVKGSIASFDTIATVQFKIETSLWDLFTGREREKDTTRRQTKRHPDGWLKAAFEFAESIKFRTLNTTSIEVESPRYANLRTDPSGSRGSLPFA